MLHANRKKRKILHVFFCLFSFSNKNPVKCKCKENNCGKVGIFLCFIIFRGNSVQKYETIISKKVEKYLQN
jgi:hypothetical protein